MIRYVMVRHLKVTVALLALIVVSVPTFAIVTCIGEAGGPALMQCSSGCPMMAQANATQLLAQQHSGAPCCNISNSRPSPAAVLQTPVSAASIAPQHVAAAPDSTPTPFMLRREQARPAKLPESPQSILCVFLI